VLLIYKSCNLQPRIKNFRQHIVFKKLASVFILCTFLLSITPKMLLHSISANHKDQPYKKTDGSLQYNSSGFNCDCNSVVATSPFTGTSHKFELPKLVHFSSYREKPPVSLSSSDHFYFKLRGPPAIA